MLQTNVQAFKVDKWEPCVHNHVKQRMGLKSRSYRYRSGGLFICCYFRFFHSNWALMNLIVSPYPLLWIHCSYFTGGCPVPPTVTNATPDQTTDRSKGAKVKYTCTMGYFFDHQTSTSTSEITCSNSAQWSRPLRNACTGANYANLAKWRQTFLLSQS